MPICSSETEKRHENPEKKAADVTEHLVEAVGKRFPLKETAVGEMSSFRARGMLFTVRAFRAAGLGHVSVMAAILPAGVVVNFI